MAYQDLLWSDAQTWNRWRADNPAILPDLRGLVLAGRLLDGFNLRDASLLGSDLSAASLRGADLLRTDLRGAQLTRTDLRRADLRSAVLADVMGGPGHAIIDVTEADFTEAVFGWTILGDIYLNRMTGLGTIVHRGPSYISASTLEITAREMQAKGLIRTDLEKFLRGAGVLVELVSLFQSSAVTHAFQSAFISYSHADKGFAQHLHETLEAAGVRCWLDEKNMRAGERILDAIDRAISSHDRVLLCCSRASLESWWVKDEILKVQEIERRTNGQQRIIPLLLDNYMLQGWTDGLASNLRARLGLDFSSWRVPYEFQAQMGRLLQALRR